MEQQKEGVTLKVIAHIHTDFPTKFGIPRQSGLVPSLKSTLVFTPPYRNPDALRGLEGFSHLWLIWEFSQAVREHWSPRPGWGAMPRWGSLPPVPPSAPTLWACPVWHWRG